MIRLPVYQYRVLDYIVKRSDFSGQPAREKHARVFSIKTQSTSVKIF